MRQSLLALAVLIGGCSTTELTEANSETLLDCPTHKIVQRGKKMFVVDHNNNQLIDHAFKEFVSTDDVVNAMHVRHKLNCDYPLTFRTADGRVGTVMPDGTLFGDRLFEDSYDQYDGTKWVTNKELFGLIDRSGNFLIDPEYESVHFGWYNQRRVYGANRDTKTEYFYVNGSALNISKDQYWRYNILSCDDGSFRFSNNGKWGLKDNGGGIVIPAKYEALTCMSKGNVYVPDRTTKKWCGVDKEGVGAGEEDLCIEDYYPNIDYYHSTPEKFDDDPFLSNIKWVRALFDYGEGRREEMPKTTYDGPYR